MTVPANRITQIGSPEEWQSLYDQWLAERKPGWVVRHAGNESYLVVQDADGNVCFDPTTNKSYYDDTGV